MNTSATRTTKVIKVALFLPITQYKHQTFSTFMRTIMENKSRFIPKILHSKSCKHLCKHFNSIKTTIFLQVSMFSFSYFLRRRFLPFFTFLYEKLDNTNRTRFFESQLIQVLSDKYGLLQKQYNLSFCASNIFGADFSIFLVQNSGKKFCI